jgi:predicted transcriptional regulator
MIGGDVFANSSAKLPSAPGRIWYEADINYVSGKRNRQRVLYSNDGLIFVTYDHYQTFYEITKLGENNE